MDLTDRSLKVLVVDDEPINVDILETTLSKAGFKDVTSTTDPLEAVRLCGENEFDLILLDILMPNLDGFGVMERLKESESFNTPIIVITALSDNETKLRALSGGARDYINKPFNRKEVLARTSNLLEMRFAQKELKAHNEILEIKVRERTKEIYDTRLEIINRLGVAAEFKDNETGLHITRMSNYSFILANAAGLSEKECDLILHASPMHDIGKIGIPDNILQKRGKLTDVEWDVMRRHPLIGSDIIAEHPSDLLQMARSIAFTHHEKWDGSGYPNGLAGSDIYYAGRIVAIADVFDALTSRRPYKEPWPTEKALDYITENGGTQFEPDLVKSFIAVKGEVMEIYNRYSEEEV